MGKLIKDENLVPDLIISSTALRAKKTAEDVAKTSKYSGDVQLEPRLYLAGIHTMIRVLQEIPSDTDRSCDAGGTQSGSGRFDSES